MGPLTKYTLGFVLSVVLTLIAFNLNQLYVFTEHVFPTHEMFVPLLVSLAVLQLLVQLILFLHIGSESKPRWNLAALVLALIIVTILVGGTLWIMNNLAHGQMQMQPDMFSEENIFPQ